MENMIVFSFSKRGHELAGRIIKAYPHAKHINQYRDKKLRCWVEEVFLQHHVLIFVGASGIAVRGIAPFIQGKDKDPAVIVVDELGHFVIPLLSGHLGGANAYTAELTRMLGATPVITTATDINHVFAVDVWAKKQKLYINNIEQIKYISKTLLEGNKIGLKSEIPILNVSNHIVDSTKTDAGILISKMYQEQFKHTLWLTPKSYVIGVGCRKDFDVEKFETQLLAFLEENQIPLHLVGMLASIDLKSRENAIVTFAKKHAIEFRTFPSQELKAVEGVFQASEFVQSITGVDNVCERSAILASGVKKVLIGKTIIDGMTVAVCEKQMTIGGIEEE